METQIRNKIIDTLQQFDLFQLLEVLNFVEFLGNRKKGTRKKTPHLDLLMAKYNEMFSGKEKTGSHGEDTLINNTRSLSGGPVPARGA